MRLQWPWQHCCHMRCTRHIHVAAGASSRFRKASVQIQIVLQKLAAMVKESKVAAVPHTVYLLQVMIAATRNAAAGSNLLSG